MIFLLFVPLSKWNFWKKAVRFIFHGTVFREFAIFEKFHRIYFREFEAQKLAKIESAKINLFKVGHILIPLIFGRFSTLVPVAFDQIFPNM